jgi:hypothetical protein
MLEVEAHLLGGRDRKGTVQGNSQPKKKKVINTISKNKLCVVAHICNPSYVGGTGRRIVILDQSRQEM